jgi:hypothetical protein
LADNAEWAELWPDLAEAPTVVDLIAWDSRNDDDLLIAHSDRTEDDPGQRRTA